MTLNTSNRGIKFLLLLLGFPAQPKPEVIFNEFDKRDAEPVRVRAFSERATY